MTKISVRHCVTQAYGLVFGQPLTLIGLTWLPAVFYAEAAIYLIQHMRMAMALAVPSAGGILGQYALFYFALLVVATALFGGVISVALTRQAFGMREERVAVYFVIGVRELRLSLALLRYYALTVVTMLAFVIAAGIAISQGTRYASEHAMSLDWAGVPFQTWLNSGAATLAVLLFLFFAVRFGFFLDAVGAVEDHARLARVRALSRGNFWRIGVVSLLVAGPALVVFVACEMTFGGLSLGLAGQGYSVAAADAVSFAGILAGALVVLHGLFAGASAAAYSELAEAAADEAEPAGERGFHTDQPAMAFALAGTLSDSARDYAHGPIATGEISGLQPHMEIATPEAESAAAPAMTAGWMPPPPDAHFGSDPHDAQPHDGEHPPTAEPLAEAVTHAESEADAQAVETHEADSSLPPDTAADAELSHDPDIDDASAQTADAQAMPDGAQHAEFPPPPLQPAETAMEETHSPG